MNKERCSNCNKYPLCDRCNEPTGRCDSWEKKTYGTKFKEIFIDEVIGNE